MTLIKARITKIIFFIVFSIIYIVLFQTYASIYAAFVSGLTLILCFGLLMCLSIIRKMPFFSLCNARFWSQCHIYLGFFALVIFALHVEHGWPHGAFNTVLFVFFLLMILTGLSGLYFFRRIPKKLMFFGPEMLFEHMPDRYKELRAKAESTLKSAVGTYDAQRLKAFYFDYLYDYFKGPFYIWHYMCGIGEDTPNALIRALEAWKVYAMADELEAIDALIVLIRQKYELDYCYAQKLLLKRWLYVHLPLAYVLIALVIIHVILVGILFYSV